MIDLTKSDNPDARLHKLGRAVSRLRDMADRYAREPTDDAVRDSIIQRFEFCYELAWTAAQDWLRAEHPDVDARGPKQVLAAAFDRGLIEDGAGWALIQAQRNLTSHTYSDKLAAEVADGVAVLALPLFETLVGRLARQP